MKYSQSAPELCTCNTVLLFSEVAAYQLDSTPTCSSSNFLTFTLYFITLYYYYFSEVAADQLDTTPTGSSSNFLSYLPKVSYEEKKYFSLLIIFLNYFFMYSTV